MKEAIKRTAAFLLSVAFAMTAVTAVMPAVTVRAENTDSTGTGTAQNGGQAIRRDPLRILSHRALPTAT